MMLRHPSLRGHSRRLSGYGDIFTDIIGFVTAPARANDAETRLKVAQQALMAERQRESTTNTFLLVGGGLAVAGLVAWGIFRSTR